VIGLGSAGYLSTISFNDLVSTPFLDTTLQSTVNGLGSAGYLSTVSFNDLVSTPFLDTTLQSTLVGLGSAGYLSTISFNDLVSTPFLDTTLQSTVNGLGSAGYLSSLSLQSSMLGLNRSLITSSLTVSSISFGNDFGFLSLGDVQTDTLSSIRIFTSTVQVDGAVGFYDTTGSQVINMMANDSYLYFGSNVIGGASVAQPQFITF
jgi:hypothetical protein